MPRCAAPNSSAMPAAGGCGAELGCARGARRFDAFCKRRTDGERVCLPSLLLVGASKSGTSALAYQLAASRSVVALCDHQRKTPSRVTFALETAGVSIDGVQECARGRGAAGVESHRYEAGFWGAWRGSAAQMLRMQWAAASPMSACERAVLEVTPNYLYEPEVPARIRATYALQSAPLPRALRFVVLLREPVARAESSYWFKAGVTFQGKPSREQRGGSAEHMLRSFRAEIATIRRVAECAARAAGDATPPDAARVIFRSLGLNGTRLSECMSAAGYRVGGGPQHHVGKGMYAYQLARWFDAFGRCAFWIASFERFHLRGADGSARCYADLFSWAGLPTALTDAELRAVLATAPANPTRNAAARPLPHPARRELAEFFGPHNAELSRLLGDARIEGDWRTASPGLY